MVLRRFARWLTDLTIICLTYETFFSKHLSGQRCPELFFIKKHWGFLNFVGVANVGWFLCGLVSVRVLLIQAGISWELEASAARFNAFLIRPAAKST